MGSQIIDEKVGVILSSNTPISISWKGRDYKISKIGLHHNFNEGETLIHVFSVTSDTLFFKLKFDTKNLEWRLLEIYDGRF